MVAPVVRPSFLPQPVEFFEAHQRVLVHGVLMIKLVLHKAREPAKLRQEFAQQIQLVHAAQNAADRAGVIENLKKDNRVITGGGMIGKIIDFQGKNNQYIIIDNEAGSKLKLLKSSIVSLLEK